MVRVRSLPGGVRAVLPRGWLCISGTIVPVAPQIHITRVVVSQYPFANSLALALRMSVCSRMCEYSTVYMERHSARKREGRRVRTGEPTRSICKPPRNESVNPVTSFAAILALRRRRSGHFPTNPPGRPRLECKSVVVALPGDRANLHSRHVAIANILAALELIYTYGPAERVRGYEK